MLKREVKYEDFDGNEVIDTFYFNLTKSELIELEVAYEGGLQAALQRIIESKDAKQIVSEFKKIVLLAYGVKSDDGKRFLKNDELRDAFVQTAAYDALFMDLATNSDAASSFILGIIPKDFVRELEKVEKTVNVVTIQPPSGQDVEKTADIATIQPPSEQDKE